MASERLLWFGLIAFAAVLAGTIALDRRDERRARVLLAFMGRLFGRGRPVHAGGAKPPFPPVTRRVVDVTRDPATPVAPQGSEQGVIVDVDLSVGPDDGTTRGRWLRHVLDASAPPFHAPREDRGLQRLRLVRPVEVPREDDTPAPEAQRAPILPPPSSSPPLRPSRR